MSPTGDTFLFFVWVVLPILSLIFLRLKIRTVIMRKLAGEFELEFTPSNTEQCRNHIQGAINGHKVHIFDNYFSGPNLKAILPEKWTVVEIDGRRIRDKLESLKWGDPYLTSISDLRKILENLQTTEEGK